MIELVLARYRENLFWLNQGIRRDIRLTVYNKSGVDVPGQISLPNIPGSLENFPYLYHMIHRYDTLEDWTFFAQAYPFDHVRNFREIFNYFPATIGKACLSPAPGVHFFVSEGDKTNQVEGWCYGVDWDKEARDIFSQLFTCVDRLPEKMFFSPGPHFAASRELLHTRTKLFYEKCLEVFLARPIIPGATFQGANHTGEPQPPSAWEWERVWQLIWDPQYTPFVRY
jgi:hypothetical protein